MKKPQSPKLSPSEFKTELVATMRSVLDVATGQIEKATPATKAKMAQGILLAASDGITDPEELTAVAMAEGKQPAD